MKLLKLFLFLTITVFFISSSQLIANENDYSGIPPLREWPEEIARYSEENSDRLALQLSDAIFDRVSEFEIFEFDFGGPEIGLKVKRDVYDNHDILQSYSVVDRLRIPFKIPLYSAPLASGTGWNIGFSIGAEGSIEFLNIRHVMRKEYENIQDINILRDQIFHSDWYTTLSEKMDSDEEEQEEDESYIVLNEEDDEDTPWYIADPLLRARYGNFLNLIKAPIKLPMRAKWLDRLQIGEIISYNVNGAIQLGPSVGWSLDPSGISDILKLGASFKTYLKGKFRISVLRSGETHAKVKLSRMRRKGAIISVGGQTHTRSILEGIIFYKYIPDSPLEINPFKISLDRSFDRSFDVVYEYDLTDASAKHAFERAMLGRFAVSDELALAGIDMDSAPVRKSGTMNSTANNTSCSHRVKLGFVHKHGLSSSIEITDTEIVLPDGNHPHRIFTGVSRNSRDWKIIWGSHEKMRYNFTVRLDPEYFKKVIQDPLSLVAEGTIEDSRTLGPEMQRYISEVEISVGKKNLFPRPPAYLPVEAGNGNSAHPEYKKADYGRSSFLFRLRLTGPQLRKFIHFPKEKMWPTLEKAFALSPGTWGNAFKRHLYGFFWYPINKIFETPSYIIDKPVKRGINLVHANRIISKWKELKTISDPEELVKGITEVFSDRKFGFELFRLIRASLEDETISCTARGSNKTFGVIWEQDSAPAGIDLELERIQREINFDDPRSMITEDENAKISDPDITEISENHQWEIEFKLKARPKFVFFRVRKTAGWPIQITENTLELVVPNQCNPDTNHCIFNAGKNVVVIDRSSSTGFQGAIASALIPGNWHSINIGMSIDGKKWGPLLDDGKIRFKVKELPVVENDR